MIHPLHLGNLLRESVEQATVYLTPQNRRRLANLCLVETTRKINEALDRAFEKEEQRYFEGFMHTVKNLKPITLLASSVDAIRRLRESRDNDYTSDR